MQRDTTDGVQQTEFAAVVQIIDQGTITQTTTGNFPTSSEGTVPGSSVDEVGITEVSTDVFPTNPPTPPSWPHDFWGA